MLLFSFFTSGGVSSLLWDDPASHCGIFVRIVEALTSVKIILRYTHNARIVWMWTYGIALTSAISYCSIYAARGYTHFFCLLCVSDHVLADAKRTTEWIKILDHGTHTTVGSLHPHRILSKHIFAYTGFSKEYHLSPFKSYLSTFGSRDWQCHRSSNSFFA